MVKVATEVETMTKRISIGGKKKIPKTLLPGEVELVCQLPAFLRASNLSMQRAAMAMSNSKEVRATKSGVVAIRVAKELASMRKRGLTG